MIGWKEIHRGRIIDARNSACELIQLGRLLDDPRSVGFGLNLLSWIAILSNSYVEALDHSNKSLSVAVTPWDRMAASLAKGDALMLRRRTEEAAKLLEEQRGQIVCNGAFYCLTASEPMLALHNLLQGNLAKGIRIFEETILRRERGIQGRRRLVSPYTRRSISRIIAGNERPALIVVLKNLPILLKLMIRAPSRLRALAKLDENDPHYDPNGFFSGKSEMLFGLLCKTEKK